VVAAKIRQPDVVERLQLCEDRSQSFSIKFVVSAQAGNQSLRKIVRPANWFPACAGMTPAATASILRIAARLLADLALFRRHFEAESIICQLDDWQRSCSDPADRNAASVSRFSRRIV
jgi:hypothetical protein